MFDVKETHSIVYKQTKQGTFVNQYLVIKTIGEGPYSKIKMVKNIDDNKLYAIKKYNLYVLKKKNKLLKKQNGKATYTNAAEQVKNEVKVMRLLEHANVAKLQQIMWDDEDQKLYLVLQYCAGGDIANWNHKTMKFTINRQISQLKQLKRCLLQLAKAVLYLHSQNVVHRDIKPQNILIDDKKQLKLIDFGRAVKLDNKQQRLKGSQGTYEFMAPQMLSEMFPQGYLGQLSDMWSIGITIYTLIFRTLPFYDQLLLHLFNKIEKGIYQIPKEYSQQHQIFIPIIKRLLVVDPRERMTCEQLVAELKKMQE